MSLDFTIRDEVCEKFMADAIAAIPVFDHCTECGGNFDWKGEWRLNRNIDLCWDCYTKHREKGDVKALMEGIQ
jgi:hypothetical protein